MSKLTGRTRHRLHQCGFPRRPTLVLQVEETYTRFVHPMDDYGTEITRWRDATIEDLQDVQ